jgi:hypothetical protein
MKKVLISVLLAAVMAVSITFPAMAAPDVVQETVKPTAYQEIEPFMEFTRIYYRWSNHRLQFRVWGIVSGRWLTDWAYI